MPRLLFGHDEKEGSTSKWTSSDWTASDDRVRGGSSQSYLKVLEDGKYARFCGTLDFETLGGAGFASQRTTGDLSLDVSDAAGVQLLVHEADSFEYTFILKDEIPARNSANNREQSSTSWEYNFSVSPERSEKGAKAIFIPWNDFKPYYRGKKVRDADPLDKKSIKRISIMARSLFGKQKGDFSLTLSSISTFEAEDDVSMKVTGNEGFPYPYKDAPSEAKAESSKHKDIANDMHTSQPYKTFWETITCCIWGH